MLNRFMAHQVSRIIILLSSQPHTCYYHFHN